MNLLTYARLYHWYKLPFVSALRFVLAAVLATWVIFVWRTGSFPNLPVFFASVLAMVEVVYWYKIRRTLPDKKVSGNPENIYSSFTIQALDSLFFAKNIKEVVKSLIIKRHIQFMLHKANLEASEIPVVEIDKDQIAKQAFDIVKNIEGSYVTRMDIFAAYLLLSESQTQFLFKKHLKPDELLHILYWARVDFPQEENPPGIRATYWGEGLFDNITFGWTPQTQKYITDITLKVLQEKPTLLGRKQEFQTLVSLLNKPQKNNVLLVGDVGVGKTSLVEALALNSYLGFLPGKLYHQRVYQLMVNLLVAGSKDLGELEQRLEGVMTELSHAGNIILFIPDLENIIGGTSFNLDLTGALIPYIKNGKIPVVGIITPGALKTYVEPAKVFADLFEQIRLDEVDRNDAIQMMLENANDIEEKNHVTLTYKAIVSSVDLAKRFIQDRVLPGSAASLLASVAASASSVGKHTVDEQDIIAKIEQRTKGTIAAPGAHEKDLLLHLENKLHERIIGQEEAVSAISQAIRRIRSGMAQQNRPISFLFLGPTGVGKTETAKALAETYFGGEDRIIRLDMSEFTSVDSVNRLLGSPLGYGNEKGELTEKVFDHPFSMILLDEFEKAHPEVLDLFLQVFEDGRLTDSHGKKVSFANTIIIATSNAGSLFIQDQLKSGKKVDQGFLQGVLEYLEQQHVFKPELVNRFDGIIVFKPLTQKQIEQIASLFLVKIQKDLKEQDMVVDFDNKVLSLIASAGFDPQFGARPLRRYIQDNIEDKIAKQILEGEIVRGSKITVDVDKNNNMIIE